MQVLRHTRYLARFVLAWFVLSIGAAVASPMVKPQAMELICSGAGSLKLVQTDDGTQPASSHTLDCPLCSTLSAPPPLLRLGVEPVQPLAHVPQSLPAAPLAALSAAPLPARGPPVFS